MSDKDIIICRCEDITREDIRKCMERGFITFEDLKRQLRVGMGPCQGQTCSELIKRELADFLGEKPDVINTHKTRPLVIGVKLKSIKAGVDNES
ncbi:MAG: (2Fe-2S)-binding protein [Bacilli bacterium]|nr:(2Fe-2S)-binding protein [Bacilli bacterium]MBN2696014.1 (2Fe-2S)-binding protein [Bacilli bacterium]